MDLNKMVNDSLAKIEAEGYVESVVDKRVKETIGNIVSELLSSYSDFGKILKDEIKTQLNVNLNELDIGKYNVMVVNAINEHFQRELSEQGIEKLKEQMNNILCNAKKEYKLSELIQQMKDDATKYDDSYYGKEISFSCLLPHKNLFFIYIDPDEGNPDYKCRYKLVINRDGTAKSISIGNCEFDNRVIMGGLRGLEKTLFQIYASGAKIIVDDDNVVLEYDEESEDEC